MTMTTHVLSEIEGEVYTALGLSEETDDHVDELIAAALADAGITIDENWEPGHADREYTRQAVRKALERWQHEGGAR